MTFPVNARRSIQDIKNWTYGTLTSHKARGMDVQISSKFLMNLAYNTSVCPLCGRDIVWGGDISQISNRPALDRIDDNAGITKENVWLICYKCNSIKKDITLQEFVAYCRKVSDKYAFTKIQGEWDRSMLIAFEAFLHSEEDRHMEDIIAIQKKRAALHKKGIKSDTPAPWIEDEDIESYDN
jgi:hypothetical protein